MTLESLTALMSKIGRENPSLMSDRNVSLFVQACIEEVRKREAKPDPAPVDFDRH